MLSQQTCLQALFLQNPSNYFNKTHQNIDVISRDRDPVIQSITTYHLLITFLVEMTNAEVDGIKRMSMSHEIIGMS